MKAKKFEINTPLPGLRLRGKLMGLSEPRIMGILNATPDSFFAASRVQSHNDALKQAEQMLEAGADILDLGAYSTRPGAAEISVEEEGARLFDLVEKISQTFPEAVLSIDTFRSEIAREALLRGAHIVNDISGATDDPAILQVAAEFDVPFILMHKKGTPSTMQQNPHYEDVLAEVFSYFSSQIEKARGAGVKQIVLDPGFGFGKNTEHNYTLMRHLDYFHSLGLPILVGISRKGMIWRNLGINADEALNGTTVLHTLSLLKGSQILRVHDVKEAVEVQRIMEFYSP
ncbi:MAG: dihydropteroate synthase [Bacteroidetes bacterium]|nr:MAG: dihydropteroate synthase [Bacteroidota bacterium]